jgi:branched-subunit amino acid aminotransferase/4-amino-4-deoxychorismate lyase
MPQPLAFCNGQFLPADQLTVPVWDAGFVLGATITEQLRTFNGQLFGVDEHLARFANSLEIAEIAIPYTQGELAQAAHDLAARNHLLLADGDDLGLCLFATPGPYSTMAPAAGGPLVAMHTYPLPFRLFADKYRVGQSLAIPSIRQISPHSLPRELKCRSRMHYYLADLQARHIDPHARALMLDEQGFVLEATTANVLIVNDAGRIVSPPPEKILPGISVAKTLHLADALGVTHEIRDLHVDDLLAAREVMLTSTSMCILPATQLDGAKLGDGAPGPVYRELLAAWSKLVGLDIAAQAERFVGRISITTVA